MSLSKRVRAAFKQLSRRNPGHGHDPRDRSPSEKDWQTIKNVWPDGTWTMPWPRTPNDVMDGITQCILIDAWAVEDLRASEAAMGMQLDPAKFYANPVPDNWKPTMSAIKAVTVRSDPRYRAFLGAKLENMGMLNAG